MEFRSLKCPNCGGGLEIEDGIDTFFCKYCGQKIILDGQSKEAIKAKVKIKEFQHNENLQKSKDDLTKYKIDAKAEEDKRTNRLIIIALIPLALAIISIVLLVAIGVISDNAEEKARQKTENQVIECIKDGDYDSALVYVNQLPKKDKEEYIELINSKINEKIETIDLEIPFSSKYAKGKNYEEIIKMLKDTGFTNISASALKDDSFFFKKTDEIEKIIIDGKTNFNEGDEYKSNVKIVVYYYE